MISALLFYWDKNWSKKSEIIRALSKEHDPRHMRKSKEAVNRVRPQRGSEDDGGNGPGN